MAMSKKTKIWLIVLATPLMLIALGAIAAKLYFTGDRLKAIMIPKIEEATGRTVFIKDISLSVFPTLAISLDSLKISNPPGIKFERDEFVSLENLRLKVKILELLRDRLEISYVILNHPKIYLELRKDGRKNYSGKGQVSPQKQSGGRGTGELLLSSLEINDGEIESVDKKFDSRLLITGLNQTTRVESKPGENTILIEGTSRAGKVSYGSLGAWYLKEQPLEASSRLTYDMEKDVLSLDSISAKLRELPLTARGTVSGLQKDTMMLDISVTSPGIGMAQLLSLVPPEMLKQAKGLSSSGDVKFSLTVKGPSSELLNPGTKCSFTISEGKIQYASLPKSITNVNLSGTFDKPSAPVGMTGIGSFSISKFSASLGGNDLNGKLSMTDFSDPYIAGSFSGSANLNEVKDFYPLEQGTELAGTMKANISLEGKIKTPENIKANGNIEFQNVTIKSAGTSKPIRNLNGTVTFSKGLVESKLLTLNIGESDLNISFTLRNYLGLALENASKGGGIPSATVTLNSGTLRTADLTAEEGAPSAGAEKKKGPKKTGGLAPGIDIDANVTVGKLVTEKFTFNDAHGTLSLSKGIMNLKNFSVKAFQGTIQTKGTLDMRDTVKRPFDLDLSITSVESNSMLPNFTSFGNYLFGKLSMNTKLRGDLNDTLGLNPNSLLGEGNVKIAEGKLSGLPIAQKLADFTSLSELREVNFKDWTNAFSISNGKFIIKDLKITAGATNFLVGGSQGLDGSLDYTLNLKLPEDVSGRLKLPGAAGELSQFFKDKDGRVNLNFQVGGSNSDPVLKLDTQAQQDMAKKALEQKATDAKQKLENDLKKKAEEGLKKLFKRP